MKRRLSESVTSKGKTLKHPGDFGQENERREEGEPESCEKTRRELSRRRHPDVGNQKEIGRH